MPLDHPCSLPRGATGPAVKQTHELGRLVEAQELGRQCSQGRLEGFAVGLLGVLSPNALSFLSKTRAKAVSCS